MFFLASVRAHFNAGVCFAVSDVVGQQFVACAEVDVETAHFKTGVDASDRYVKTKIVFADSVVCVNRAVVVAVDVFDVAVFMLIDVENVIFRAVVLQDGVALDESVGFNKFAVNFAIHLVATQVEILIHADVDKSEIVGGCMHVFAFDFFVAKDVCRALLDVGCAVNVHVGCNVCAFCVFGVHQGFAFEIVFTARKHVFCKRKYLVGVNVGLVSVSVRLIRIIFGIGGICKLAVLFGVACLQVAYLLVDGLTEIHAQRNVELVKHVFDRAKIGHKRGEHKRKQRTSELNLELSVAIRKSDKSVSRCGRDVALLCVNVACRLGVAGFVVGLVVFLAELVFKFLRKLNEVVDLGVVFSRGDDLGEIHIERAVVEIQAAQHFLFAVGVLGKVAVFVNFKELYCKLDLVEIAVFYEFVKLLAREQAFKVESRQIDVCRHSQTDACVECGQSLQIDDHIAKQVADKTACVGRLRAVGVEVDKTAHAQSDVLVLILRHAEFAVKSEICNRLVFFGHNAVNDFLDCSFFSSIIGRARARVRVFAHEHVFFFVKHEVACGVLRVDKLVAHACHHSCITARVQRHAFRLFAFVEQTIHTRLLDVLSCGIFMEGVIHGVVNRLFCLLEAVFVESVDKRENVGDIVVKRDKFKSFVNVEQGFVRIDGFEIYLRVNAQIERPSVLLGVARVVLDGILLVDKRDHKTEREHLVIAVGCEFVA